MVVYPTPCAASTFLDTTRKPVSEVWTSSLAEAAACEAGDDDETGVVLATYISHRNTLAGVVLYIRRVATIAAGKFG